MSRQAIEERDELRRTVARQDRRIAELEAELRQHQAITEHYEDRQLPMPLGREKEAAHADR